ncbi:hypothetical protein [Lactobacillus sp. Sy-1]|uniref:hypothetical protein n=1 Tax=Lactobacillus sp. Sy-1 TaxID=2109645 RepID=UPI001C5A6C40|nr:hypothetical protein [Lactobacillus sp. Sy-1]MBW1606172.1 hypothetical protein [Lactobacillus sp. Sy-1]
MKIFIAWLGFFGDWLLFVFPLYQGLLDVTEGSDMLKNAHSSGKKRNRMISSLLWLLPPLKVLIERRRVRQISKYALNQSVDFNKVYRKLNVATAWVYVSLAGVLNGIVATEELLEIYNYGDNWWILLITSLLIVFIGIKIIQYFVSDKRKKHVFDELS